MIKYSACETRLIEDNATLVATFCRAGGKLDYAAARAFLAPQKFTEAALKRVLELAERKAFWAVKPH